MSIPIRRLLIIFLITGILLLLGWIPYSDSSVRQSFWQNFWPNFWSDLAIAIILAPFILWLIARSKKVEAKVIAAQAKVIATEDPRDDSTHSFTFSVKNTCSQCFNKEEIYWHVYVEDEYYLAHKGAERNTVQSDDIIVEIKGKKFRHITGILEAPVFPQRYVQALQVQSRTPYDRPLELYYFLSTIHGLFPKSVKLDRDGEEIPETLGRVERHFLVRPGQVSKENGA